MYQRLVKLMIVFLFLHPSQLLGAKSWQIIRHGNIYLFYHSGSESFVQSLLEVTLHTLPEYRQLTNLQGSDSLRIFLCENQTEFDLLTSGTIPTWSKGVTRPQFGVIILQTANIEPTELTSVLRHELWHAWLGHGLKGVKIPRWFDEGTAVLVSGQKTSRYHVVVSRALLTKSLLSLDEVDDVLRFQLGKAQLAYAESFLAVQYLINKWHWARIRNFFAILKKQPDWQKSFTQAFGMDQYEFEEIFFNYLHQKYRWNFLLDANLYLWTALPLLVLLAFIIIRLQNRRTVNRWEQETKYFQSPEDYET